MRAYGYSMPAYFQDMPVIGSPLSAVNNENAEEIIHIEQEISDLITKAQSEGRSDESLNEKGQLTAMQRINGLVDEGTWCPLNSLYNPFDNENGSTSVIKGIGRIAGKWAVVVASDNKKRAGAWVPGQAENLLKAADTAKILRIPLVYLLNCSGVQLDEQELLFPGRRSGGASFFRNAELAQLGIPVLVGVYGTNPAGGGYHAISPAVIIAHKDANMAVGGAGILSGMKPKGYVDEESAMALINAQNGAGARQPAPGGVGTHHESTGFFREVCEDDMGVIDALRRYMDYVPAYDTEFFRVAPPQEPLYPAEDLYHIVPINQKRTYDIYQVLARLFDSSQFSEFKPDYGPEVVCGLARLDGLLVGVVANKQGIFMNYPEYRGAGSVGVGGKLYRQGLIKMSEFVTLCNRDRIPMVWLQDSSGIDVDDIAEKAELLGLGQSLIYSIQSGETPFLEITLRKGSAAAHYVLGGPQCEKNNPFSLAAPTSEYYVMHGETAAAAMYVRQLVKANKAGQPLDSIIQNMNDLIEQYQVKSRPKFCAKLGMVDEIVPMSDLRNYMMAFTQAAYQNPATICPTHQMLTPRAIREYNSTHR
ncbi:MAG: glutaconyl-CoA decarboxylase subunit alpha [Oscillospiraceae bacterium]|nr:glutaconyl-CoA decarboxylase subunit alpha [Oscillospiraceae bacterium]